MSNVLDGEWVAQAPILTVAIPIPEELFGESANPAVVADFISGVAARIAREEYLKLVRDKFGGQLSIEGLDG